MRTSMTMILAEELDADWSQIKIEQAVATSELKYGDMTTGGSESVRSSWDPLQKGRRRSARHADYGGGANVGRAGKRVQRDWRQRDRAQEIVAAAGIRRACRKSCGVARSQRCAAERSEGLSNHRHRQASGGWRPDRDWRSALRHRHKSAGDAVRGGCPSAGIRRAREEIRRGEGAGCAGRKESGRGAGGRDAAALWRGAAGEFRAPALFVGRSRGGGRFHMAGDRRAESLVD